MVSLDLNFVTGVRNAVRRLAIHLDPRTSISYRRSAVRGSLPGALDSLDRQNVNEVAERCGYTTTEATQSTFHLTVLGVTLVYLDVWIDDSADSQLLREDIALPGWMMYAVLTALGVTFSWVYFPAPFGVLALGGACVVFGLFLAGFAVIPSPLARYLDLVARGSPIGDRQKQERLRTVVPTTYQTSCIGPPVTALLGGLAATGPVFLTGLPILAREIRRSPYVDVGMIDTWLIFPVAGAVWLLGFWGLGFVVGMFVYSFENEATRIEVFPFDVLARASTPIPELSGGYLSLLGLAIVPIVATTESSFLLPAAYRLSSLRLWTYFMFPASIVASTLPVFLYWWVVQNREYVYSQTLGRLNELGSPRRRLSIVATAICASGVLVWTLVRFFQKFRSYLVAPILNQNFLPILEYPLVVLLLLVSLLPAAYVVGGVIVQLATHLGGIVWIIVRSAPAGESPYDGVPVRLTPSEEPQAAAIAVGPWKAIIISQGLRDCIDGSDAFAALLAHEEAHLRRNGLWPSDAQLSTLLPILASVVFTGKNVFFALADYRSRELIADNHAARVVGEEPLARALDQLSDTSARGEVGAPFFPLTGAYTPGTLARPGSIESALERYFGLLFGNFALVRAHPELKERVNRLRDRDT